MSADLPERMMRVLSRHDCFGLAGPFECLCGVPFDEDAVVAGEPLWEIHVAAALMREVRDAGYRSQHGGAA